MLVLECELQAVISLPSGVFKPYSGVGTAVLIFRKTGAGVKPTQNVWFYEISADGYSLSDTRAPIEDNDIPDLLEKWPKRAEGKNSFLVSLADLKKNNYELLTSRYRQQATQIENHDKPRDILDEVLKLETKIVKLAQSLREKL